MIIECVSVNGGPKNIMSTNKKQQTAKELEACAEAILNDLPNILTNNTTKQAQVAVATAQVYATLALSRRVGEFRHFWGAVQDLQYKDRIKAQEAQAKE